MLEGDRCHLVVVGVETGGRWSQDAHDFIHSLAAGRSRDVPPIRHHSAQLAWLRKWMEMLASSCDKAFAASLLSSHEDAWTETKGRTPDLADLSAEK